MRSISDLDNFSFGTYLAGYVLQRLLVHDVLIMFLVYFWEVYISNQWAMA
jgi:alpha/beta superfamily hydrolase